MGTNLMLFLVAVIAYVIGSIPTGYLFAGKKIMQEGSGNIGAMNTLRTTGSKGKGIAVMLLDAGKAVLVLCIVKYVMNLEGIALIIASLFIVSGHNHSVFMKFKGGKGLASLLGILLFFNWISAFVCLGIMVIATVIEGKGQKGLKKIGEPILGRVIGMVVCILTIAFLLPEAIYPAILAGIVPSFIAHIERLKVYLQNKKESATI